jgi:anti-anti-sigma factor
MNHAGCRPVAYREWVSKARAGRSGMEVRVMGDAVVNRSVEPDGTVVVELRGELDLAINEALRLLLVETATTVRPPRIVVDMLHVSFVDSTGIGALAAGYSAARSSGVEFTVRHLAPFIADQLKLTGLYEHLVGAEH